MYDDVLVVCRECYNAGHIDKSVVLSPRPLYFVFENSKNTRNELSRLAMGTIFLVYVCMYSFFLWYAHAHVYYLEKWFPLLG